MFTLTEHSEQVVAFSPVASSIFLAMMFDFWNVNPGLGLGAT